MTIRTTLLNGAAFGDYRDTINAILSDVATLKGIAPPTPTPTPTPPSPTPTPTPPTATRLMFSAPLKRGQPVNNVTLLNRTPGSAFTTTFPGITIDNATGAVSGTPTEYSGLIVEHFGDGSVRENLLFAPKTAPHTMGVGINLGGVNYYTPNYVFLDYFKASEYQTVNVPQDANGVPTALAASPYGGFECKFLLPFDDGSVTPVKYRIITDGDLDIAGWSKEGDDYVRTYTSSTPYNLVQLYGQTANFRRAPTYLHMVRDDEAALFRSGEIFKPGFLADMVPFDYFRTMNVNGGNLDNPILDLPTSLQYTREGKAGGWPFSILRALALKANMGIWLNIHVDVTLADFVANYLPMIQGWIAEGILVYCEYSNEVWNETFGQFGKARDRAIAAGYNNGYFSGEYWVGKKTAEFAKASRGSGIRWLVGSQTVQQDYLLTFLQAGFDAVAGFLNSDIWGWIPTWYVGGPFSNRNYAVGATAVRMDAVVSSANVDGAFDLVLNNTTLNELPYGQTNSAAQNKIIHWRVGKQIANARGWQLVGYEGNMGFDLIPNANQYLDAYNPFLFALPADPMAKDVINAVLCMCEDEGFHSVCAFDYYGAPVNTYFGRYGLKGLPGFAALVEWGNATPDEIGTPPPPAPAGSHVFVLRATRLNSTASPQQDHLALSEFRLFNGVNQIDLTGAIVTSNVGINGAQNLIDGDGGTFAELETGTASVDLILTLTGTAKPDRAELQERINFSSRAPISFTILGGASLDSLEALYAQSGDYGVYPGGVLSVPLSYAT